MKLILHNYWRSSASHRVRIGLGLKGLTYEYAAVNIIAPGGGEQLAPGYAARNPMRQVPTLELIDDAGASLHLVQSLPILEYLDERWPTPALLPRDPVRRATARALAEIVNAGIQPFQNLTTLRKLKALGADEVAWTRDYIAAGLAAFDALAAPVAGRCAVGDEPTLADCCLIPQLLGARRFAVELGALPRLLAIEAHCLSLPAFAAAAPDQQPDAVR
jgi:maleylpyruvate isomerase